MTILIIVNNVNVDNNIVVVSGTSKCNIIFNTKSRSNSNSFDNVISNFNNNDHTVVTIT